MQKKNLLILFLLFSLLETAFAQKSHTISGFIREKGSKEQLIGVNIYIPNSNIGTTSNTYGFYSLTIPARDSLTLVFSFVGYQQVIKKLGFLKDIEQNIELESANQLAEVTVSAKRQEDRVSDSPQMSVIELPINQIKKIPTLLGEKDVLKVLQLMPGVQKGSEGQAGIYVRGGGPDQNLIILDDAVVYNANHLFGFFSTFNGDALKSVELTKAGFPARFGGRLSSVIELNMKDGNKEKLEGEGGIGLISSRLVLDGPIRLKKNAPAKASFLVSGRRTYLDAITRPILAARQAGSDETQTGGYFFQDFNAKLNYEISNKDKVYLSGYFGKDKFNAIGKTPTSSNEGGINWGNYTTTFRWNHLFSQKLFSNTSLILSNYQFNIEAKESSLNTTTNVTRNYQLAYQSGIRDYSFKYDFDFFPNQFHAIKFGLQSIFHRFTPSAIILRDTQRQLSENRATPINTIESGVYIEDVWQPISKLKFNVGLRISHYKTDSTYYLRPEPRVAMAYKINKDLALKASFAQMNQYIHLLSNTGLGLPTDLWVPATNRIAPQNSKQWAIGLAQDLDKQGLTLTLESYYKRMDNIVSYKEGASFLSLNSPNGAAQEDWQSKIIDGNGYSYGVEFLVQKKVGRFSGWVGYTWSKTRWKFAELNFGQAFYPRYDRRHDASVVGIYELSKRITLSATWVYGTGNALTIPVAEYVGYYSTVSKNNGTINWRSFRVNEYGEKNSFRAEPYHRLDVGLQFHKKMRRHERTWDFSFYNVYNRKNPFFYIVGSNLQNNSLFGGIPTRGEGEKLVLKRYSLFPFIPSFSYNFKF
ncbi:TonB-dependent receptor [Emticicia oligotrophica]|uniref:TonB-dependent receptor n=1 Tax=Emticicia oligotrophica TaxID=312279 RepID=UPI00273CAC73|nr:TonB-dependent receptor [Emticicia oligotrophica]